MTIFGRFLLVAFITKEAWAFNTSKAGTRVQSSRSVILYSLLDDSKLALQGVIGSAKTSLLPTTAMDSIKAPFELPPMQMPDIALPPMLMPNFALPSLDQKSIELPSINLPSMDFRLMDFSNFGAPDLQVPPPVVIGLCLAVSAVLIAGRGSSDTGAVSENSRKSKSTLKYEIPYDAAARLAYDAWCRDHGDAPFNAKGYAHFREIYEAKAVADATSKKLARELTVFENKARPSAPHRQVAARSTTKESAKVPFFFARVN